MKKCLDCKVELTNINAYYYERKKGYDPRCKSCQKAHYANYYQQNKEKRIKAIQAYNKNRENTDLLFKLKQNLRSRIRVALKNNWKSGSTIKNLGCSIQQLKEHLESKFLPGMNWENHDKYGWHIDHIMPLSKFDLSDPEQLKKACHYSNLQPLWWYDNLSKGNR